MDSLRVSATDLDALRRFRADEDADFDAFLRQLRREEGPTPAMLAGTALHKALENAVPGEFRFLEADGYAFDMEFDGEIDLPPTREIKGTMDFTVDGCRVTLVGKVDAIHGARVDDHKFTTRYDGERFLASFQWRAYLVIFGANEFRWNIFEAREKDARHFTITNLHRLTMHRYPDMRDDLVRELTWFVQFARAYLPERIGSMAA